MQTNQEAYDEAEVAWRRAETLHQIFLQAVEAKDEQQQLKLEAGIQQTVTLGLWEHWKSEESDPKFYVVMGVGTEQDVHTPLVAYASLYGPRAGDVTFRNLIHEDRGFLVPIDRPSVPYVGPRFVIRRTLGALARTILQVQAPIIAQCKTRAGAMERIEGFLLNI